MPLDSWKNYVRETNVGDLPEDVLKELLRQAEMHQEAIFRAALGMDQRASILAGGFAAAAGALAAAGASASGHAQTAALFSATCLAIGAGLCAWACRPQSFRFPGIPPNNWTKNPSFVQDHPLNDLLHGHLAKLQDWIRSNEVKQRSNARFMLGGLFSAIAGPFVSAAYLLASSPP